MIITINKAHGKVHVNAHEIELLIKEQLEMVPGIITSDMNGVLGKLKKLASDGFKTVRVYPLSSEVIGITCHVKMFEGANFSQVSKDAQNIIKFSVEKKYELTVDHIDIVIEGFVER